MKEIDWANLSFVARPVNFCGDRVYFFFQRNIKRIAGLERRMSRFWLSRVMN